MRSIGGDVDVLIVGAGISGIGTAWHLQPWVELENVNPGSIQRGVHLLPGQGSRALAARAGPCLAFR